MATTPPRLHPLHVENLNHLVLLRHAILQDPVTACYEYGVDKKSAKYYRDATDEELLQFAYSVDMSLFVPRFLGHELCKIINAPGEIRGVLAAANVRACRHGQPGEDQSRDDRLPVAVSEKKS